MTLIFDLSTPTPVPSDKLRGRSKDFPTLTSVLPKPIVGSISSPTLAFFTVASLETSCAESVELTLVPSLTTWSFNVIAPVSSFIVTTVLSPFVIVHLLLSPLLATIFVASCVVFVTVPFSCK